MALIKCEKCRLNLKKNKKSINKKMLWPIILIILGIIIAIIFMFVLKPKNWKFIDKVWYKPIESSYGFNDIDISKVFIIQFNNDYSFTVNEMNCTSFYSDNCTFYEISGHYELEPKDSKSGTITFIRDKYSDLALWNGKYYYYFANDVEMFLSTTQDVLVKGDKFGATGGINTWCRNNDGVLSKDKVHGKTWYMNQKLQNKICDIIRKNQH